MQPACGAPQRWSVVCCITGCTLVQARCPLQQHKPHTGAAAGRACTTHRCNHLTAIRCRDPAQGPCLRQTRVCCVDTQIMRHPKAAQAAHVAVLAAACTAPKEPYTMATKPLSTAGQSPPAMCGKDPCMRTVSITNKCPTVAPPQWGGTHERQSMGQCTQQSQQSYCWL
jgi:hypothetical protein